MRIQKGITLVSLVISIIVLIILTGISINTIIGENSIIIKAKESKVNINLAKIKEEEQLNNLYEQLVGEGNENIDDMNGVKELENKIKNLQKEFDEFREIIAETITNNGKQTQSTDSAQVMANNITELINEVRNQQIENIEYNTIATTQGYSTSERTRFTIDVENKTKIIVFYAGFSDSGSADRQLRIYADDTLIEKCNGSSSINNLSPYQYVIDVTNYSSIKLATYNGTSDSKAGIILSYCVY